MDVTNSCRWGAHGLCGGLSTVAPCPCDCHHEPTDSGASS